MTLKRKILAGVQAIFMKYELSLQRIALMKRKSHGLISGSEKENMGHMIVVVLTI